MPSCVSGAAGERYGLATSCSFEFGDLTLLPAQLPPGEQADHLTGIHREAHAANDGAATVCLGEFVCAQRRGHQSGGVAGQVPPPLVCVRTSLLPSTLTLSDAFQKVNVLPLVSLHSA